MLAGQSQYHQLYSIDILGLRDHRLPSIAPTLHLPSTTNSTYKRTRQLSISSSLNHHQNPQTTSSSPTSDNEENFLRTHNAKSSVLLLRHLSPHQEGNSTPPSAHPESQGKLIPREDKAKLLKMSLIRKRTPQFPGSIYVQCPSGPDFNASLPPLQNLFEEQKGNLVITANDDDDEMLMKALEIRRGVTVEIFKEAMRKGKFGITYSTNLISKLSDFIDFVMIQVASMKQLPEFSTASYNFRARTFIDDSGVVPLIRWLKHNSLSYPQIAKLICMSRGNLNSIRRLAEWLKTIYVRGRYIGVALTRAGGNILECNSQDLDEIVGYLEDNGVRKDWMGYVVSRCPEILSFSMEELKGRVEFYLNMGMDEKDFGTMVFDFPKVLGYFPMEEMNQKVTFLKEFGLNDEEVGKLLAFKPQLMACSIEEKWKPLVKYFYYLGMSRDSMRRILCIKPMIFCVDLETIIVPKFLRDIGVQEEAIGNMIAKFPPLLTYSLNKKIRPVVVFLLTKAGVSQRDIGKVIALGPELLGCSIANKLDHNVKYFLSLGISLRKLGEMIADFPILLRYNVDLLRPKYQYLRRTMVRPLQDLIEFPRFFSYSLDERIIPRHRIMVEQRVNFKLRYMLGGTDEEFDQRVQAAVERRQRFESGVTFEEESSDSQTDVGSLTACSS
ncbi:transcription termination factor MTERF2, chloroplastic-like isoform X2 [Coffea arabica]|uniref:Transcription termination factor MTERF2, chloroplastic-like isoform X2 n=1 Tax=Coffea arabica TaxID=13443 RepID=A0A6P6WAI7_COFAR|nr:transcription termination factor MTERF2, chloroplastic-like isoform X2 [Coffea arabica]